jgi:hypothetical protein
METMGAKHPMLDANGADKSVDKTYGGKNADYESQRN